MGRASEKKGVLGKRTEGSLNIREVKPWKKGSLRTRSEKTHLLTPGTRASKIISFLYKEEKGGVEQY